MKCDKKDLSWPLWLKWGFLFLSFPLAVLVANFAFELFFPPQGETQLYFFLLIASPALPVFNLFFRPGIPANVTYLLFFLAAFAFYFLLGALLALAKQKLKG